MKPLRYRLAKFIAGHEIVLLPDERCSFLVLREGPVVITMKVKELSANWSSDFGPAPAPAGNVYELGEDESGYFSGTFA